MRKCISWDIFSPRYMSNVTGELRNVVQVTKSAGWVFVSFDDKAKVRGLWSVSITKCLPSSWCWKWRTDKYIARSLRLNVLYWCLASLSWQEKNAKGLVVPLTPCWRIEPMAESDASTVKDKSASGTGWAKEEMELNPSWPIQKKIIHLQLILFQHFFFLLCLQQSSQRLVCTVRYEPSIKIHHAKKVTQLM